MAARNEGNYLEPRHTIIAMAESLFDDADTTAQFTTLTPHDPFLTAMDFSTFPSFTLSSTPAASSSEGMFGADSSSMTAADSSEDPTITLSGSSAPTNIYGTSTVSAESTGLGPILTASGAPSSSSTASQVLYPSLTTTFAAPPAGGQTGSASQSPAGASSNASPTQTQGPEPSAMGNSNLSGGALAAAIVVPVIALALFAVIGVFVARRRQRRTNRDTLNEHIFAPETIERNAGPPPHVATSTPHDSVIPWPIVDNTSGQRGSEHDPRPRSARPSLAHSDPFGDSRQPSNASQTYGTAGAAAAVSAAGAQQAEKGLLAPHQPEPQPPQHSYRDVSPPRPGSTVGDNDDAVSAVSDTEYQQAQVGIAHRVSVVKMGSSPPHGGGGHLR
ncbi:MAG: hypothetical protein M1828_001247 [Chrysothrix sp. TS-e1954]|nr:MAG: hypothetical protein M1828_001247 [Chrysothrix sp. TS-e1954]